jgi:hypothetical protein
MNNLWDVHVTIDATMSGIVRGVAAESASDAAEKALEPQMLLDKSVYFQVNDDNFSQWVRDAYLPDPSEGVEPHEPALKTPELSRVIKSLDGVLSNHLQPDTLVVDDYLVCRCPNAAITAFVDRLRMSSSLHQGGPDFLAEAKSEAESLAKIFSDFAASIA